MSKSAKVVLVAMLQHRGSVREVEKRKIWKAY